MTEKRHVTLGVTGCIGAYKAVLILRALQTAGAEVEVVMTRHATEFIQPLTFQALTGRPVVTDMWGRDEDCEIQHIALAQRTDALLVAPATANCLAKFAHGLADDFLSTLYLATVKPVLVAPAMNVEMWNHPAVQENCRRLRERGVVIFEPDAGFLACGMVGAGRLAEPEDIVRRTLERLQSAAPHAAPDLGGERIVITAGPTVEDLDPVRFLTNRSSGKMGYALAEVAHARGAEVTLVTGPTRLSPPPGVRVIAVRSTREMYDAVLERFASATIVIKAAAVCDYRPARVAAEKIKKDGAASLRLELEPTEDILAEIGRRKEGQVIVGFAAETTATDDASVTAKLRRKRADFLILNDVSQPGAGFDGDTNQVTIFGADGMRKRLPLLTKRETAEAILDVLVSQKNARSGGGSPS